MQCSIYKENMVNPNLHICIIILFCCCLLHSALHNTLDEIKMHVRHYISFIALSSSHGPTPTRAFMFASLSPSPEKYTKTPNYLEEFLQI